MQRRRALVPLVALLLMAGLTAGAFVAWRVADRGTPLGRALAHAPEGTERATWTDWAAVRRELGVELAQDSTASDVQALLDDAFARDLSSGSALGSSAIALHEELGLSPATLRWELFTQSPDGAVELLAPGADSDLGAVRDRLESLGWRRPEEDDGVWVGGPDVLAAIDPRLTPELQHVAVLDDEDLVLTSDQPGYLERAVAVVRGEDDGVAGLAQVAEELGRPVSAVVYDGAHACERLAMAQADADAQAQADQLVEAAGGVHPMSAFAMGSLPGGDLRVAIEVEDEDDVGSETRARARLASGPAPGQGGDFADRFEVAAAASHGRVVTLDLRPAEGQYVLSDLSSGPVLFATC